MVKGGHDGQTSNFEKPQKSPKMSRPLIWYQCGRSSKIRTFLSWPDLPLRYDIPQWCDVGRPVLGEMTIRSMQMWQKPIPFEQWSHYHVKVCKQGTEMTIQQNALQYWSKYTSYSVYIYTPSSHTCHVWDRAMCFTSNSVTIYVNSLIVANGEETNQF